MICLCNKNFIPKNKQQKYCSKSCGDFFRIKKWRKNKRKPCVCGKMIAYDSIGCRSCANTNDKLTKQEALTNDTQKYRRIRSHARVVAKNQGILTKCVVCGYDKHVECSHKKAIILFNDTDTLAIINHPTNLIGLCPNHHWEYDNDFLDITGLHSNINYNKP